MKIRHLGGAPLPRRALLGGGAALVASAGIRRALAQGAPAIITSEAARPRMPLGVMSGDVTAERAIVWSKTDRPARLIVEYSTTESFRDARRVIGEAALETSDFTARVDLTGLPAGQQIFYRAAFQDLKDVKVISAPLTGRLRTPPAGRSSVSFAFSGDEVGQGWGINPGFGGMKLYEAMRRAGPDFFIHSGDQIYADGPLEASVKLADGTTWTNIVTEAKSKVCESLADYRGAFAYNLLDENKRRFAAEVPFLVQWDDHEVRNNWYPGEILGDPRYKRERSLSLLSAWARRAMFEYNPYRIDATDPERVYRQFGYGPLLDVFMLDERSYRGPNTANRQTTLDAESGFLGSEQLRWLKQSLLASRATWKVIASDMPIGLVVPDANLDVPKGTFEAWANADDGAPSGRELELASLLSFIKNNDIRNVVWVTADVHYASANHYDPARARFADFKPFWEFVAGPINAGTFGPNDLDRTFGPEIRFTTAVADMPQNRPPSDGMQYFGLARIDGASAVLTMSIHDLNGKELYQVDLSPEV